MAPLLIIQEALRPISPLWGVIIPASIFLVAFVATLLLYRHFSKQ